MKRFAVLCVAVLVALLATIGLAPAAQAYPDVTIDLTAKPQVLYGGETFTATGTSNVDCAWTMEWDGVVRTGAGSSGSPFSTIYTADDVTKITKIPLHGTCAYTDPSARAAARASAAAATWKRTIIITVLPRGNAAPPTDNSTDLPNTGGPSFAFLLGGLALLLVGATAVTVARRRAEDVDILTGQA
jgi:LPXTG-motif cell wall-anchored protein